MALRCTNPLRFESGLAGPGLIGTRPKPVTHYGAIFYDRRSNPSRKLPRAEVQTGLLRKTEQLFSEFRFQAQVQKRARELLR